MGQEEAKVKFSESGSQQVVAGFKNVGQAAGGAATNVGQAGNAIKNVGAGMKGVVSSIGQVAGAFATLSLSIVNTYRSYRDLEDTQIAVNTSNIKLTNSIQKLHDLQAKAAELQKKGNKGSTEQVGKTLAVLEAQKKLQEQQKKYGKNSLEAALAQNKVNKAMDDAKAPNADYLKAQREISDQEDIVANNKLKLGEAIERQNDAQQNFYLSLLPTVLASVGTIATVTSAAKTAIGTGTGGLIGSLGGIGLVLGGLSLAVVAYQNNWLGFKDVVGGAIDWVKERLDLWKQGFAEVFDLIKKGDWKGAFDRIKLGAIKFWEDLKKSVPFFGGVATLVDQLMHGNWLGAFNTIKVAAIKFWADMKILLPFLADIESIVEDIKNAKWSEAFTKIKDAATSVFNETLGKGFAFIFGENWKLGLDAWLKLQESEAAIKKRPLILQYATTINATITALTGIDFMKWFKEHPIAASIPFGLGFFVPVDDPKFRGSVATTTMAIIKAIGEGLDRIAGLMDPYIAGLFVEKNWTDAIESSKQALINAGKVIWKHIFDGIGQGLTDQNWLELLGQIPMNIQEWTKTKMPETFKTSRQAAAGGPINQVREKLGVELNPIIPDNFWTRAAHDLQVRLGIIHPELEPKLVLNPEEGRILGNAISVIKPPEVKAKLNSTDLAQQWGGVAQGLEKGGYKVPEMKIDGNTALLDTTVKTAASNIPKMTPSKMPIDGNVNPLNQTIKVQVNKVGKTTAKMQIDGNTNPGLQKANALRNSINNMKATIKVGITPYSPAARAIGQSSYDAMVRRALGAQHGMHQTLSRDTLIHAHKGEQVDIDQPAKQARKTGNGNGNINVRVFIGDTELKQLIHYTVNEDQGISK